MGAFGMTRDQTKELWGRIEAPVLHLTGSESWFNNPQREDFMPYFKNAEHRTIENAGHWLHHDQLDEFLQITQEFLGRPD